MKKQQLTDNMIASINRDLLSRLNYEADHPLYIPTSELREALNIIVDSCLRAELTARPWRSDALYASPKDVQCDYCASADSGHNVHCRNFREAMLNV